MGGGVVTTLDVFTASSVSEESKRIFKNEASCSLIVHPGAISFPSINVRNIKFSDRLAFLGHALVDGSIFVRGILI